MPPPTDSHPASPDRSDSIANSNANANADADADAHANFARAFQELAKGERTASAMETQLTALERKIDDLLATIASPEAPGLDKDNATTELVNNATDARGAQPEEK